MQLTRKTVALFTSGIQYPFASLGSLTYTRTNNVTRYMTSLSFLTCYACIYLGYASRTWISKIKMFLHGKSLCYFFELTDKYFEMSYPMDISLTNICIGDILGISSFHPGGLSRHGRLPPWEPCGSFGPWLPRPYLLHPSLLQCAAAQSQPPTGPFVCFQL